MQCSFGVTQAAVTRVRTSSTTLLAVSTADTGTVGVAQPSADRLADGLPHHVGCREIVPREAEAIEYAMR
jgi:hypothetical protein